MSTNAAKVALVTGSSRGIGRAAALRLARDGYDVVVHYRRSPDLAAETAQAVEALGRRAWVVGADLEDPQAVDRLAGAVHEGPGRVDVLVLAAAATAFKTALEVHAHHWERTYRVVVGALYQLVERLVPLMPRGAAIICISGTGSDRVIPRYSLLGAAKAAQEALVRYLAVELAPRGIRVNGISPGIIRTDSFAFSAGDAEAAIAEDVRRLSPAGRLGRPEDIAGVVAFLASEDADFIRGQIIVADGGITLGMPALYSGPV
jgi:enoyl-[acyl-carrier protein] reductase III